ncbi:LysM peptidoglycan-binding domain-containing protein [Lentilactobacillus kisonensis]|uniref:LysM domain protein n=1 Tax=Lentilactobacillus kisonensis DSM 19906 = JCM 15041 TaxID=1423766 RepID=A0A0R1P0U4_9LACO|nr:LysM domain-containing protein [Lentilactobacillus kisonensis]KRL23370.1 LysM domain protein [Lentilactobacillus kisonensis DSM 19906 = JCM 15041]
MNTNNPQKKTDDDQPWNQTFSEDRDENGNLSRVKLRKESQNHHLITIVLAAIIIIVALVALAYGLIRQSAMGKQDSKQSASAVRVVRQDNAKKKSSKVFSDTAKKSDRAQSEKAKTTSSSKPIKKVKKTTQKAPQVSSQKPVAAANTSVKQPTATSKPTNPSTGSSTGASNVGSKYATVEAGQGLYRVAVNHGITLAQLMQLNGLSTNSAIHPGQRLRIK